MILSKEAKDELSEILDGTPYNFEKVENTIFLCIKNGQYQYSAPNLHIEFEVEILDNRKTVTKIFNLNQPQP